MDAIVNGSEFFGIDNSSHVFSYLTGYLNVDFIDEIEEDVISTNRQSLNWDLPDTRDLKELLANILRVIAAEWRSKRQVDRRNSLAKQLPINPNEWYKKLPDTINQKVKLIVECVVNFEGDDTGKEGATIIENLHDLVPEYPYYHWRHLHKKVQDISYSYYQINHYHDAISEVVKKYVEEVRNLLKKSGYPNFEKLTEREVIETAFLTKGTEKSAKIEELPRIDVTKKHKSQGFQPKTLKEIQNSQYKFSEAAACSVRNVLAHGSRDTLKKTRLFSDFNCLDILSILSYLYGRLDDLE